MESSQYCLLSFYRNGDDVIVKLIFTSRYIRDAPPEHLQNYVRYISTREGVEKVDESKKNLPATLAQKNLIRQILKDMPESKDMLEYEDYRQHPTIHDLYRIGREANRMRHDMSAKLSVVYMQMKKGAYEDAEKSLKKLGAEWGEYLEIPDDTGNEGLNAALIKSIHECREKGIRFHYAVLGNVNGIDSLDMGNLVHNLLQNGIEACSRQGQEREMEIVVRRDRDMIEIEMDNTAQEYVLKKNPLLKTSKKEKEKHGFGMESIREIVERYHGNYELWEEKGHFFQRITLKIKCEQAGHDTERV